MYVLILFFFRARKVKSSIHRLIKHLTVTPAGLGYLNTPPMKA